MAESGTKIFLRIFELSPTVRDVFNYTTPGADPEDVANNPRLKYHALAFMQALDDAITVSAHVTEYTSRGRAHGTPNTSGSCGREESMIDHRVIVVFFFLTFSSSS